MPQTPKAILHASYLPQSELCSRDCFDGAWKRFRSGFSMDRSFNLILQLTNGIPFDTRRLTEGAACVSDKSEDGLEANKDRQESSVYNWRATHT